MPRYTPVFWLCHRCSLGTRNDPTRINCHKCGALKHERHANVRVSERAAIDLAPDGSISIPGRIDQPLHPKQIAHGVRRVEVGSAISGEYSLNSLERHGLIHEATNWNSEGGNAPMSVEEMPDIKPKSVAQILSEPDAF